MSLFNYLPGKSGEDVSTEILAYFLSSKERFFPFQRLFFSRILNSRLSSTQLDAETQTQATFKAGRPDLIILSREAMVVLENKLGAYLSGDSQLVTYCKAFEDNSYFKNYFPLIDIEVSRKKFLVFLAPQKIVGLSISASDKACKKEMGISFKDFLKEKDIAFVPLPWEELLDYLDLTDSLQNELYLFVRDYINQELIQEEKMVLQNPQIPSALTKLFKFIDELRNEVYAKGWKVSRISQSYLYYGFYIEPEKIENLYFGYFLQLWENYKTPIFLQVHKESIKNMDKDSTEKTLIDNSFVHDRVHHFIRPFKIDSIESWKDELTGILRVLIGTN